MRGGGWLGVIGWVWSAWVMADDKPLKLVTEELPPFNMEVPLGVGGWVTEKVTAMATHAGIPHQIEILSWARALELARTQADHCVYSTAQNPERLPQYRWIGPLVKNEWVLWRLASAPSLARLEDARNARIGSYHANAGTKMLQQKGYQVVVSVNHEASLRNLMAGRLDYWLAGRYTALALIANANALDKVVPALVVDQFPMYLACNPQTNELTLKKLEAAFQQLSQDGTFVAIDKHYDNWLPSRGR